MSFLDEDQATAGRISLGTRRAGLESLLPRRRRRQAAQQQQTSGYDILPSTMQPIPGVVSTPTDIARVGVDVSQQLQQQGTTAAQVPNVFERYAETGAAPIGDFRQYLYPSPPTEEDEEENDVIEATNEEFADNFGFDPSQSTDLDYGDPYNISKDSLLGQLLTVLDGPTKAAAEKANKVVEVLENVYQKGMNKLTGAQSASEAGFTFTTTTSTGQTVPTTESSGRTVTLGAMQGTPFGSTPDADGDGNGGGNGGGGGGGGGGGSAAPSTNFDPTGGIDFSDPSISVGDGGGDGGDAAAPSTDFDPTGGIDPNIFASGGIVTKSKTKNKTSFMSMKGK